MSLKKGQPGFKDALRELREGYVDSYFPNLTGYAYQADIISEDHGYDVMLGMLRKIVEIEPGGPHGHPEFRLKGETQWRSVVDTDDFPVPTDEPWEEEEEEQEPPPTKWPRTLFNRGRR